MRAWILLILLVTAAMAQEGDRPLLERVLRRPEFAWKQGKQLPPPLRKTRRSSRERMPVGEGRTVPDRTGEGYSVPLAPGEKGPDNLDENPEDGLTPSPEEASGRPPGQPGKPSASKRPPVSGRPSASHTPSATHEPSGSPTRSASRTPSASKRPPV